MATDLRVHFWSSTGGGGGGGGLPSKLYAGSSAIGSGVSSVPIVFTSDIGSTPIVLCWLSSSDPTASIITSQGSGITSAGFTAQLSATTPDTTYTLNWIASLAND